jgi:hypothetical protein
VSRTRNILVSLLVCAFTATWAHAQDGLERELDVAKALYRDGRLEEAVSALRTVITKLTDLSETQTRKSGLADAHLHLGLSYLALRDEPAALDNFRRAIAWDPARTLDPDIYAPRTIGVFERARSDVEESRKPVARTESVTERPAITSPRILPGTKIRVQLADQDNAIEGVLLRTDAGTFTLSAEKQNLSFAQERVTRVEVMTKRKRHWLAGMIIGAAVGAAVGASETPGCDADGTCWTRGENIGYTGVGLGLIGALVGALYQTEDWGQVPVAQLASLPASRSTPLRAGRRLSVAFVWRP